MSNYYQKYYQGNRVKESPGRTIRDLLRDMNHSDRNVSVSQDNYRKALIAFLEKKGVEFPWMRLPARNMREGKAKINAMITILRKNGWDKEFFEKEESNVERSKSQEEIAQE